MAIGGLADGRKVLIALRSGYRESSESWKGLLRDLRERGLRCPHLVVGDGYLGIWAALTKMCPEADKQRCWKHKQRCWKHRMVNVLDQVPKRSQEQVKQKLRQVACAPPLAQAERQGGGFERWAGREQERAARLLDDDWERMVSYYRYPQAHWRHLRMTKRDRVAVCGAAAAHGRCEFSPVDKTSLCR